MHICLTQIQQTVPVACFVYHFSWLVAVYLANLSLNYWGLQSMQPVVFDVGKEVENIIINYNDIIICMNKILWSGGANIQIDLGINLMLSYFITYT